MRYIDFNPNEIWENMTAIYYENGGDTLNPGDEKEILLKSVLAILTQEAWKRENAIKQLFIDHANDEYLDELGKNRGILRNKAKQATVKVEIKTINAETNIIPKGTVFRGNENNVYYQTTDDITLYSVDKVKTVLTCTEPGAKGNGEKAGNTILPIYQGEILYAEVLENANGGEDEETDESYRYRIKYSRYELNTMGTKIGYESNAKAIDTAIIDSNAIREDDGSVKVYLIADEKADKEAVIAKVQKALNKKEKIPLSDTVKVEEGKALNYTVKVKYKGDQSTAITNAVKEFKNITENKLKKVFDIFILISKLYEAGATSVNIMQDGSTINGSTDIYKKHNSGDGEYWKGEVVLENDV